MCVCTHRMGQLKRDDGIHICTHVYITSLNTYMETYSVGSICDGSHSDLGITLVALTESGETMQHFVLHTILYIQQHTPKPN